MHVTGFLGELVQCPALLNESSYNLVLFGEPSTTGPWGFSFYGHNLSLNIFLCGTSIVCSPCFNGAEPNVIDQGPYKGTRVLRIEEQLGLELMRSLSPEDQRKAQISTQLERPAAVVLNKDGNLGDQRHLWGPFRDNRVLPYEGVSVFDLSTRQRGIFFDLINEFLTYLPQRARQNRYGSITPFLKDTYFCWMGGFSASGPFYYRIQGPAILLEFSHEPGKFLSNKRPSKFHSHTLMRSPNGGDYGMSYRRLIELSFA